MAEQVGYEIDFLPVGTGTRCGDAIAIRYGSASNYKVIVYDGGTKESGQALVNHIKTHYGTTRVDYVVNSHPDGDHASGLSVVLEQLEVGELWMHQPWNYSDVIRNYFKDGRITSNSLGERLKNKMSAAYALEQLAEEKGIPVYEPFRGADIGGFFVLSPEQDWYVHNLITEFSKSPEQKMAEDLAAQSIMKSMAALARKAVSWVAEHWGSELLHEDVETSAENESSVVLYGVVDGRGILLTGDAGVQALTAAADFTESRGVFLSENLKFVQMPHHGSRNNVSPTVLERILGPTKASNDGLSTKTAFVSTAKESTTHPRKSVTNAFIRRGADVSDTKGKPICSRHNFPARPGWVNLIPMQFSGEVEAWD